MGTPIRLGALLLALALLSWLLLSQYREEVARKKLADRQQAVLVRPPIEIDGFKFGVGIGELDKPFLLDAENARGEVRELCATRRNEILWPDLTVPVKVGFRTFSQFSEDYLRFRLREFTAYCQLTDDRDEARVNGEAFVEAYVRDASRQDNSGVEYSELLTLGQAAIDAGSKDPLLRTYYGFVKWAAEDKKAEAEAIWREVLEQLPQTRYPKTVQVYARCFLHDVVDSSDAMEATLRWRQASVAIVHWLEEERKNPEWSGSVCHRLLRLWSNASDPNREILLGTILQSRLIDPYIAHLLAGEYYADLAWKLRGGAYAKDMTDKQVTDFEENYQIAADHLSYAWKLHPELPYAPVSMIPAAMSGTVSTERPYFWFVQTIDAQFDYYLAYSKFLHSLLPRWGGSHQQMLLFARNCLNTRRFQTQVPYFPLIALETLVEMEEWSLDQQPEAVKLLRDLVEARDAYRKEHPDEVLAEEGHGYSGRLIGLLEQCELVEMAAAEIQSARRYLQWLPLQRRTRPGRYYAARLVAAQGELRAPVLAFDEKLRRRWDASRGLEDVSELAKECGRLKELALQKNEATEDYFRHVEVMLQQLRRFTAGEPVPLNVDSQLTGWEPYCDKWATSVDGGVELSGRWRESPQVTLRPLANFYPPLEFEGQLELLDPEPYLQRAGVGWSREGMSDYADLVPTLPLFGVRPLNNAFYPAKEKTRRDFACMMTGYDTRGGIYRLTTPGAHRLRLKLWTNAAEYRVDDQVLLKLRLPDGLHPEGWLCLGENGPVRSAIRTIGGGSMRWRDLQVRRLSIESPPLDDIPLEQRVEYWENRSGNDPADVAAMEGLCGVRYEQGRDEDALALADEALAKWPQMNGIHYWKALVYFDHFRDYAAAEKELDIVLNEPSDNPEAGSRCAELRAAAPDESRRNLESAKSLAELMKGVTGGKHARSLAALAVVRAAMGEFDQAIELQNSALELVNATEKHDWKRRLELYKDHQPYRLPTERTIDQSRAEPKSDE